MNQKPIAKFKCGTIECAIWKNEKERDGAVLEYKTVSLRKSWRQDDQWHDATISLRRNDLQKMILVLQKAQESLLLDGALEGEDNE